MNGDMIKTLLPSFIGELEEYTQTLESDIIELENTNEKEILNKVFRAFHSIKGSAGIIGFKNLSQFTHKAEFLLEESRSGRFEITKEFIDVLLTCNNIFKEFLSRIIESEDINSEKDILDDELVNLIKQTEKELNDFSQTVKYIESKAKPSEKEDKKIKKESGERYFEIKVQLSLDIYESGNDPIMYLRDLLENGEYIKIEADLHKIKALDEIDPLKHYISWEILYKTKKSKKDIENIFLFIIDENTIKINDVTDLVRRLMRKDKKSFIQTLDENDVVFPSELNIMDTGKVKDEDSITQEEEIVIDNDKERLKLDKKTDKTPSKKEQTGFQTKSITSQFIKVDIKKIDELVKLVGEMVIGYSQMIQSITELIPSSWEQTDIYSTVESFHRTIRDIQDKVMKVRMVPIGPTFAQFKLLIRDYVAQLNKKVKLELYGEDTELDKRVIEMISDPLRHMVRNSVDHGIESIEERIDQGKPEVGTIKLNAYHEEGNMVIEIIDDGRGLNKDIILKKAIEKGLYDPKVESITDDSDIFNFIFEPGFSTAEAISDLSGRGVGMDVVKNNIESLRGKIYVDSEAGIGTTFKIALPLTVSIIDGMIFRVGDKLFILPLLSINELIRPEDKMIKLVEGRSEVVNLRGEFIPMLKLYEEFSISANIKDPTQAIMLIIETEGRKYGIMVDELVGQQQVVIKPLDQMFEKVKGITGASILGNGKVALILDAPTLIRSSSVKSITI